MTPEALDACLERLHTEVAPVSPAARQRIARLLALEPPLQAADLRESVVAVLATRADEAERLRAFLEAWPHAPILIGGRPVRRADGAPAVATAPLPQRRRWPRRGPAVGLGVALVVGLAWIWPRPPQQPLEFPASLLAPPPDAGVPTQAPETLPPPPKTSETLRHLDTPIPVFAFRFRDLALGPLLWGLVAVLLGLRLLVVVRRRDRIRQDEADQLAEASALDRARIDAAQADAVIVPPPQRWRSPPAGAAESAALLSRLFQAQPGDDLDADATLSATTEAGGLLHLRFESRRIPHALTLLIDTQSGDHIWLGGLRALAEAWKTSVDLHVYEFSHHPDALEDAQGRRLSLAELAHRADGPLVLASPRLLWKERKGGSRWPFLLEAWPQRAWLDPDPRPITQRGELEAVQSALAIEATGLPHFPLTPEGLRALVRHLGAEPGLQPQPPAFPGLPDPTTPGYAEALHRWQTAIGLVPDADWEQVEHLRRTTEGVADVFTRREHVQALIDHVAPLLKGRQAGQGRLLWIDRAPALKSLISLRNTAAGRHIERQIRQHLLEQLEASPEPANPYDAQVRDLKIARHRAWLFPNDPECLQALRDFQGKAVAAIAREDLQELMQVQRGELRGEAKQVAEWGTGEKLRSLPWRPLYRGHWAPVLKLFAAVGLGLGLLAWSLAPMAPADAARGESVPVGTRPPAMAEVQVPEPGQVCPHGPVWIPNRRVDIELVCLAPGEVTVRDDEGRTTTVQVAGFYISRSEVTNRQYKALGGTWQGCDAGHDGRRWEYDREDTQDEPVRCIDRGKALEVAALVAPGGTLPSEAQWQRAFQARDLGIVNMTAGVDEWLVGVPPQVAGEFRRSGGQIPADAAARMTVRDGRDPQLDGYRAGRRRSDTGFRVVVPSADGILPATEFRPAMLPIPAGSFMMGSLEDEAGREDDEKQHRVTLANAFWLARTEVTQAQWQALMGDNPSRFKENGAERPVEQVSWFDALRYLNRLSEREGLTPCYVLKDCDADGNCAQVDFKGVDCPGYRLPSEAEWEYGARAGSQAATYGKLEDIAWFGEEFGTGGTHPVGAKTANAWGLHDMLGNVCEWVQDAYQEDTTANAQGTPIEAPLPRIRVYRGCGWYNGAADCRAAYRYRLHPGYRNHVLGFRPARFRSLDP